MSFTFYLAFFRAGNRIKMLFWFVMPFLLIAPTMPGGRIWYQGNRMYLPLFAVLAVCFICFDAFYTNNKKYRKRILAAAAGFILLCSGISSLKAERFKNGMLFWSAVYNDSKNPTIVVQNRYADSLLRFGYPDEAFPALQKALADSGNANLSTIYNLANYYFILGEYKKAAGYFEATTANPMLADAETYANLFICGKFLNNEDAAKFYYGKTFEKLNGSYEETNKYISGLINNLKLAQKNYMERSSKNN
jgi:tetratricopeptide (TPR) repeat protein